MCSGTSSFVVYVYKAVAQKTKWASHQPHRVTIIKRRKYELFQSDKMSNNDI